MDIRTIVYKSKPKLIDIASLLAAGKHKAAYSAFGTLVKNLGIRDLRLINLLAGLVVSSVQARLNPRAFEDPLTAFEDPLTAFEDPLTAFEDPLTAFEDPLTAFKDPTLAKMAQTLVGAAQS
ncbi:MAG: hypothetical protein K0B06_12680 [Brevefilum sp.]|nr:hypothetical protein [Brevefilum sp.]